MSTVYAKTHEQKSAIAERILNSKGPLSVEVKRIGTRSAQQNAAMHLYLEWVAKALNEAGLDMRVVLAEAAEIPWTKDSAKELLWRPIQKVEIRKGSTTELYKMEVTDVYEVLNRFLAGKGIHLSFPSESDLYGN